MIIGGIVLIILAALLPDLGLAIPGNITHLLFVGGAILLLIGIVFWILGAVGRPIGGRTRWY